jgi:hypothetical protein
VENSTNPDERGRFASGEGRGGGATARGSGAAAGAGAENHTSLSIDKAPAQLKAAGGI